MEREVNLMTFYFICQEYGLYPGFEVYCLGFEVYYDNKMSNNSSKTQNNSITLQLQCYYCDSQHPRQWTLFQNCFWYFKYRWNSWTHLNRLIIHLKYNCIECGNIAITLQEIKYYNTMVIFSQVLYFCLPSVRFHMVPNKSACPLFVSTIGSHKKCVMQKP